MSGSKLSIVPLNRDGREDDPFFRCEDFESCYTYYHDYKYDEKFNPNELEHKGIYFLVNHICHYFEDGDIHSTYTVTYLKENPNYGRCENCKKECPLEVIETFVKFWHARYILE